MPIGIAAFDEFDFASPSPLLHTLLTLNVGFDALGSFKVNEIVNAIFLGKPFNRIGGMLKASSHKVVGHSDVQCPVGFACKDVYVIRQLDIMNPTYFHVMPAKAGIHFSSALPEQANEWIPACAGITVLLFVRN